MIGESPATHITSFRGLYARGSEESVPKEFFKKATNIRYFNVGCETRFGTTLSIPVLDGVRRWFPYHIEGQANRIVYLDTTGKIFDSLFPDAPILSIPNMTDFSMVVFNDRVYLSPHNRITGLAGQVVYVYQGNGAAARPAGGAPPAGYTLQAVTSAASGKVEAGIHLFAIANITDTGFTTGPGPEIFAVYSAPGDFKVHLSNIGVGPTGTVGRAILATKIIENWDGDQNGPELFFIPGAILEDNVTTEIDVDFYDADLVRSADYLRDEMATIPAVLGLAAYQGSLMGWAPNVEPSSVYISKAGEPESISLIEGGIEVDKSQGGGIKNCVEFRSQLMIHKNNKTYATSNNDQEPIYWPKPVSVDSGVGTSVFGVAAILDEEGNTTDRYVVAAKRGLLAYAGTFDNNLTYNIDAIWKRISKNYFDTLQVALDPISECIYVAIPIDGATSPNVVLYGDYSDGLDAEHIRWAMWTFPYGPNSIGLDTDDLGNPVFKLGSINGNIYFLDPAADNDNLVGIPTPTIQTAYVGSEEAAVSLFVGTRIRASGTGILNLEATGLDGTVTVNPPSLVMTAAPGKLLERQFELMSQYGSLQISTINYGEKFRISRISLYHSPYWMTEPA
jgi:hypothetical protein